MKNNLDLIGCDETGVGDYFSPIIFVAAYVPDQAKEEIINLGVKDSKKLSDKKIVKIASQILDKVFYTKTTLTQKGNNSLARFLNVNEVKLLYHYKNIVALQEKISKPAIIDQFSTLRSIAGYEARLAKTNLNFQKPHYEVLFETKAEDNYLSVAVASILARYFFLKAMQEQNEKYKVIFPFGASNKIIEFGKEFIKIYGKEELNVVAKTNFKTTDAILG
ncbi:ribonuclease HIII [Mycoplasma sp. 128]|uniref:ribonuclease HIII n=1 Tax=Mycoplasma sp. 3341 TaxID=3447506 RepID=UPI003F65881D